MSTKALKATSAIIYSGPSLIDGKPIVVVACITKPSKANRKTGPMVQTYIIRKDIDPRAANKSGEDYSICGHCPLKGTPTSDPDRVLAEGRKCYVFIGQGPLTVWESVQRGVYPQVSGHDAIAAIGAGRMVRIGTYGDGAAVPSYIWDSLISRALGHTAYSHQSGMSGADYRPDLFMRSADSLADAQAAWAKGERTFRVVRSVTDIVKGSEILCPASKEAGKRTTCAACALCGGTSVKAKSIAIPAHGAGAHNYA